MSVLDSVDLGRRLGKGEYKKQLVEAQVRLRELALELYRGKRMCVLACEGWDASGKGGAIRRMTELVDPRGYVVHAIAKPEGDDAEHHYLWRFWRRLEPPEDVQLTIFDRSWYGRVLVERVEGLATETEWRRAYDEINGFEQQIVDAGGIVHKLWFHISPEEQAQRFAARLEAPHKRWKLTAEDLRNRSRWDEYREAAEEMLVRTDRPEAPWTVIAAEDKRYARVESLRVLCGAIERGLA